VHRAGIIHRDLKLENVIYGPDGTIKIIDWDFADFEATAPQISCGSTYYAAPELLSTPPNVGYHNDVWSLGVIMYAMCKKKFPFDLPPNSSVSREDVLMIRMLQIINRGWEVQAQTGTNTESELSWSPKYDGVNPDVSSLLQKIFVCPSKRITIMDAMAVVESWYSL
jgi:serine/threonine protein kinase